MLTAMGMDARLDDEVVRALVETAPDALVVTDEGGRVVLVNAAAEALFGYPRGELLGRPIEVLVPDAKQAEHARERSIYAEAPRPRVMGEGRLLAAKRRGGAEIDVEVRLRPLRCASGTFFAATVRDVSDRVRFERERASAALRLKTVIDKCPVGIALVLGKNGERVELNEHARQLVGRHAQIAPEDGLAAYSRITMRDGKSFPLEEMPAMRALRGEVIEAVELALANADGRRTPIVVYAAPLVDPDGAVDGAVVVFADITAQKQLDRMRTEWTSLVVHDLRQPLNVILLYAKLLEQAKSDAEVRDASYNISLSAERLSRMVHDLLDLSRLEVGQLPLRRERIDLPALALGIAKRASPGRHGPEGRRISIETRGVIPRVLADPDRISQVLENLLTNALKYGDDGTPITITIAREGADVSVAVTNEGAGIRRDDMGLLFQRFRRTDAAQRGSAEGVGLGLYIARGLVEAHGGSISADSTPGLTTTFRFTLPAQ